MYATPIWGPFCTARVLAFAPFLSGVYTQRSGVYTIQCSSVQTHQLKFLALVACFSCLPDCAFACPLPTQDDFKPLLQPVEAPIGNWIANEKATATSRRNGTSPSSSGDGGDAAASGSSWDGADKDGDRGVQGRNNGSSMASVGSLELVDEEGDLMLSFEMQDLLSSSR